MDAMKSMSQPCFVVTTTAAANNASAATFPKSPQAVGACVYVTKICYSASAAPAAAAEVTLSGGQKADGTAQTLKFEVPASAFAPVTIDFGVHPLKCIANTDAVLTVPALGAAVVGSAQIFGYYGQT